MTLKTFLRRARKAGVVVEYSARGHIKLRCPNGRFVVCSASPSDRNALRCVARDLRRIGGVDVSGR